MHAKHIDLLADLDLEPIMVKAMDHEEGFGWDIKYTRAICREYKRFLALCMHFPDDAIVPSAPVDDFWHLHILDTQKYAEDCHAYLGYFLHHFPYFGMRGEQDLRNLEAAWNKTLSQYELMFDEKADSIFWPRSKRCPNCGRKSTNDAMMNRRPRLADLIPA
jgi:hypothetical protein